MKKRFAYILMMLMLITQGAQAQLYFESGGIYYEAGLEIGSFIDWRPGGKNYYYAHIRRTDICAPPAPYKYEGVIKLHRTTDFPGADYEYEGEQVHMDPISSLEVNGCDKGAFENSPNLIKVIGIDIGFDCSGVSFKGCISLQTLENIGLWRVWAHQFDGCSSLTDIDLSKTEHIEEYAFVGCSSLKDIKFHSPKFDCLDIEKYAFSGCCSLETISFDKTPIFYDGVFSDCNRIKKVISGDMYPAYFDDDNVFTQTVYKNALLVVPKGTVETYKATKGWKNFYNIVEEGSEPSIDPTPSPGPDPSTDAQPYAVYNDYTLTFYCDNLRSSREGTTYDLNTENIAPDWLEHQETITKAVFDISFANARPTTAFRWFGRFKSLMEIQGISNLNTSEVTDMRAMFDSCDKLSSLNVSHFDTRNVTKMDYMFSGCSSLTNLDVSNFDTRNVISMERMFARCKKLTVLDVSNFDTRNVTFMINLFEGCNDLTNLILGSQFVSIESTNVSAAFIWSDNLSKVTFTGDIPSSINNKFFEGVGTENNPATLDVPEQYKANYAAKFDGNKFYGGYFQLNGSDVNPPIVEAEPYVVYNDGVLTFYCDNQRSSRQGETYDLNTNITPSWLIIFNHISKAKVIFDSSFSNAMPVSTFAWFRGLENLKEVEGISYLNTCNVETMNWMFEWCTNLTSLDISKFNTANVKYMARMFYECGSLTNLIIGSQFTSNESTDVTELFYGCSKLSKVTFTGDIPASINSRFFEGVGTADAPAILDVPEQYKANYAAKFDGNKFYGGYFQLSGDDQKSSPLEMTFKVLNAVDGIVYYSKPSIKLTVKNNSENEFKGKGWYSCSQQLDNGEWFDKYRGGEYDIPLPPGEKWWASSSFVGFEDGFYKWEWGYEEENGNKVNLGSTIIEVRGHDRYRAIWMDSDIDNGTWKTFCDEDNLDFSHTEGLNVYIATDFNVTASEVQMQQVGDAVAGTGLLLIGETGCYLAERTVSASTYSSNMLVGVLGNTKYVKANEDGYANYIWGKDKNNKQKFNIASDKGSIVYENEAYLRVPTQTAGDTQSITPVFGESTVGEEPYVVYNDYTLTFYSDDQRSSRTGVTYSLNEGENEPEWVLDDNNRNVEKVVFDSSFSKARPTSTFQWFFYCDFLTEIKGIENLNTSEVRNMRAMFFSCSRLKSIDVSHFDTKAVEDIGGMFSSCTNLESINVSHFNTSSVYNMASMFNECQSLTDLDLSNFNTSKAEYLPYLFSGCRNLRTLYLGSGFTSSNEVLCEEAFADCQSLSKVVFTGDIPASINSEFFKGVGTADAPVKLDVPEQFEANFAAKFNGSMFYGGYFILRETIVPNDEDGGKDYSSGNSEIDETTDLNGTIIGNVYYSIAPEDGGYNSAEGCLVVTKPSPDADYDYEDPFDEEFKNMFTGIIIMVQSGSGTVKIEAETSEGMSLMVKIGNNLPIKMTLQTKSTLAIPYTVIRPTYVYIYAGGDNSTRAASDGALKIYGFSWESSSTGINALSGTMVKKGTRSLESLPKGVYIVNGRKFVKK